MLRVVVTGATSMIGVALIKSLMNNELDIKIYAVVKSDSKKRDRLPQDEKIVTIECDMKDYSSLSETIKEPCDIFYHFAWPRTLTYDESYTDIIGKVDSIKYVIEALETAHSLKCKKFVGAGTQAEYGVEVSGKITENTPCNPVRADGIAHWTAGRLSKIVADKYGMVCIWARIFSVYGIHDRDNSMISMTISKLIKGEHCSFTTGQQIWDYIYEDDIGEALYLIGKKCRLSKTYCVANGNSMPLKNYIEIIRDVVEPKAEIGFGELSFPDNPVMSLDVDISELKKDTGWMPKVDFTEGVRNIYEKKMRDVKKA